MNYARFAEKHPYTFALILTAVIVVAHISMGAAIRALKLPVTLYYLAVDVVLTVIAAVLLTRMGWWRVIGFRAPHRPKDLWLFWLPVIPVLLNLSGGIRAHDLSDIATFFFLALLVGFVEESFFRGLMLRPLALRGLWRAAIVTAAIFGLLHSLNILAGFDVEVVFVQMGYALAIGFSYAALVLRTGMIWPTMLLHFFTDFAGFIAVDQVMATRVTGPGVFIAGIYIVVFIGYGLWLLARSKRSLLLEA